MLFRILYKIGYFLSNILSLRAAYWLAERFSDIQYHVAKKDREAVSENLSIVLKKDIKECQALARNVFRNFGLYLVDFFRMAHLDKKSIEKRVRFEGIENVDRVLEEDKGVIILTCHIGSWEMGGAAMAARGYDISVVALTHMDKNINDFFIRQREKKGIKVITISPIIVKQCISTLLKKGILALVGDRDFTNAGIKLDFFGIPTSIPKGPAVFSLKTNSVIVPAFFIRDNRFNYRFIFDKPVEIKKTQGIDEDEIIREITRSSIPIMEKYIRAYPEQWLVFRKFWELPVDAYVL